MMFRTYDPEEFVEATEGEEYVADYKFPENENDINRLFDWVESFATGRYIALATHIYFTKEQDRNFFILGYDERKYR